MDKRKLILDCDPGHDDAIGIMLAGRNPGIDLMGITVVSGNQTIENTVRNALNVCQYLDLDVPVYPGAPNPMVRVRPPVAADIHGRTGLDGPVFEPLTRCAQDKHAALYMIDALRAAQEPVTIVTTGPMTNLALAMRLAPDILPKIGEIAFMGGSYGLGNVTPAAEFNIITDAEAAYVVFNSGCKLTMVGLDVTRKVLCLPSVVDRMERIGNRASRLFVDLARFFNKTQKEVFGWEGGPLHDPLTIAWLIDPSVLTLKPMHCQVDIRSTDSYGRTNCDYFSYHKREPNVNVAVEVDVERFWDIIEEEIRRYD